MQPQTSTLGAEFARAFAGKDSARMRELLHPEVDFKGLTPSRSWEASGADASGVAGTPSFFINGRRHQGAYDVQTLSRAVRTARSRAQLQHAAALRAS